MVSIGHMDTKRLEAFCKVYELKSFSKAGQALQLSQPTISSHILSLEQRLGAQLFDRLGRHIQSTIAGDVLYRHARQAFTALEGAKAEIDLLSQRVSGELEIGCSTIPAAYLLPEILASFIKLYPAVKVRLQVGGSQEITKAVLGGELALGLVGAVPDESELECHQMLDDELFILASPKMPGYKVPESGVISTTLAELANWPWVIRETGSGTRMVFDNALQLSGLDPTSLRVAVEAWGTEAVLQCARFGLGVCACSRLAAKSLIESGELVRVEAPGLKFRRFFYALRHSKRHIFPTLRFFWDHLVNSKIGHP